MLFIFRKLRRSFFLPGKVRTYCAYAAGEIILIVVGIMIALEANEWKENRRDRAEETVILARLQADFKENQATLLVNENVYKTILEGVEGLLDAIGPERDKAPSKTVHNGMMSLFRVPPYKPQTGVINSLIATGKISLIKNDALNYKLNAWPSLMEKYEYELQILNDHSADDFAYFKGHYPYRNTFMPEGFEAGQSHFTYDQEALLGMPELESVLEVKRIGTLVLLGDIRALFEIQQEILTLIEAELAERGLRSGF